MRTINYFGLTLIVPADTKQIIVERGADCTKVIYAYNLSANLTFSKKTKTWHPEQAGGWFENLTKSLSKDELKLLKKIKPSKSLIILPRGAQQ
jgi:hypothetical protein